MRLAQILLLTLFMVAYSVNALAGLNFNPGNYEIQNWIELPDGGSTKIERHTEFLSIEYISSMYNLEGCNLLSKNITSDTLSYESKCDEKVYGGMDRISGRFTFMGDSFEGTLIYKNAKGEMRVGMRGKRIGDTPDSKPQPTSSKKLDEIDKELRRIWNTMVSYVSSGNFDKALELFHPIKRKDQAVIFQELRNEWPRLLKEQIEFRRLDINYEDGYAHYDLVTQEEDGKYSYQVLFQKDQNDKWYIVDF